MPYIMDSTLTPLAHNTKEMNPLLVKILLVLCIIPYKMTSACVEQYTYHVHIFNNLPPDSQQLKLHCQSGNDDLGIQYPPVRTDLSWKFCGDSSTLFFCHFWWTSYAKQIDVWNDQDHCVHDGASYVPDGTLRCVWQVQKDGIYLGTTNSTGQLKIKRYVQW